MPDTLQKYVVNWYHTCIFHPSEDCTDVTISQHYYWTNLKDYILTHIKVCKKFQKNKKYNLRHGKFPAKEAEAIPWDRLLVDFILPYKLRERVVTKHSY